jgi:hypothetical protein
LQHGCSKRAGIRSPALSYDLKTLLFAGILEVGDAGFEPATSSL